MHDVVSVVVAVILNLPLLLCFFVMSILSYNGGGAIIHCHGRRQDCIGIAYDIVVWECIQLNGHHISTEYQTIFRMAPNVYLGLAVVWPLGCADGQEHHGICTNSRRRNEK